ncbi:MAG: rpsT [candidate division NC10 bacterium]|jgi:small subunit ribosomal protein S20|nr:rpsT [candidate division NC10 bacterium]
MPIIKSSVKDLRRTERRTARNRAAQGKLRSTLKRARAAIAAGQTDAAQKAVAEALPVIDRAPGKGVLHKNAAARHKSRLMRRLSKLSAPAAS